MKPLVILGLLLASLALVPLAHAASYTFTSTFSGSAPATDGSGRWQTTTGTNYWLLNGAGTAGPWVNGSDAVIGAANGTAGTITLSGTPQVRNLTNNATTTGDYTLTASTLKITGTTASPSVFFIASGFNLNVGTGSGTITVADNAAPNALQKDGPGALHLRQATAGTAKNTYTGGTILNAGGLTINQTNNLGTGKFTINGGRFSSFDTTVVSITNAVDLGGDATLGHISASGGLSFNAPGAFTIKTSTRQLTINSSVTNNQVIGNDTGGAGLTKAGNSNLTLTAVNTYDGPTTISAGTLALGASASLASASSVTIAAGAKLDVSALTTYTLGSSATLSASGTGTTLGTTAADIKGGTTVALSTRPISLTFTPTGFSGDTTHPSLYLETGTLSVGGNAFTVNNAAATPLGVGTYRIVQTGGSITTSGSHTVTVTGTGLAAGTTAAIQVNTTVGMVDLVVSSGCTPPANQTLTSTGDNGTTGHYCTGGSGITIGLASSEGSPIEYRLRRGGSDLGNVVPGSGGAITFGAQTVAGVYSVLATNTSTACTLTLSTTATVTVDAATTASTPADQTSCASSPSALTFTTTAGGTAPFTYQWQTNNGGGYVSVGSGSGGQTASYTTPTAGSGYDGLLVRCVVSGTCGSTTSAAATVHVTGAPTTSDPASLTRSIGEQAVFSVTATGVGLTYQWQTNSVNLTGATSASYTNAAVASTDNGLQYRCVVSSTCGGPTTSANATLTVVPGNYRSAGSGSWASASTWSNSYDGVSFIPATVAPSDANSTNIVVLSGHTVTSSGTVSADDLTIAGQLTVSGGTFTIANGAAAVDCDVTGNITQTGGTLTTTGALKFENASTFTWNANAAPAIPFATWADGSTCTIQNISSTSGQIVTGLPGSSLYNLTFNYPSSPTGLRVFMQVVDASGNETTVRHNFTVTVPDTANDSIVVSNASASTGTFTIGGDVSVSSGVTATTSKLALNAATHSIIWKVAGNIIVENGTQHGNLDQLNGSGTTTIELNGTSPQTLYLPSAASAGASAFLNSGNVKYQVDANASVTMANAAVSGTPVGTLTLNGTLQINDTWTCAASGNTVGSAGVFKINFNGGTVPTATWPAGSRVEILGMTSTAPSGLSGQTFADFTWDCAGQSAAAGLAANLATVNGTLRIKNSNGQEVRFASTQTGVINLGNLRVGGGAATAKLVFQSGTPATTPVTVNVAGNITIDSDGTITPSTGTSVPTWTIGGTFASSGTLGMGIKKGATPSTTKLTKTASTGNLAYGGTLTVTALSGSTALTGGENFDLFDADGFAGSFATITEPTLGAGLNWYNGNLTVDGNLVVNRAPTAANTNYTRAKGLTLKIKISDVLALCSDADLNSLAFQSVDSGTNGAAVSTSGGFIFYTPPSTSRSNSNDTLTYAINDGRDGVASAQIGITVISAVGGPQSITVSGSTATVNFAGIPGFTYLVQRSTNLVDWVTLLTTNAPSAGVYGVTDDFTDLGGPPSSAYYRTAQP